MKTPLSLLKHDVIEATEAKLEAYGDELMRVAVTPEQRQLAQNFESIRKEIIDSMGFLAVPEEAAKDRGFEIEMDR
jgi:flagellar biosynthesis component FlhA